MAKFAANLSMLFTDKPFLDRFAAAAAAGFKGVEYLFPYDFSADVLAEKLRTNGLSQVLHNLPAGDWANGERGIACLSGREGEFRDGVGRAIAYATKLGCPQVNCLVGKLLAGADRDKAMEILVGNLRFAADELKKAGIRLLIEPINTFDMPGFFVSRTADAARVIEAVGSDNLFIQYDVYHMQRMEGELAATIKANLPAIAHIQVAENPGRHEPGNGEINWDFLIPHIDSLGYPGWIGCEYVPAGSTEAGLGWRDRFVR